ncbi:hypothetical protein B0T25DRAFT_464874 [Lasiosphaeria hispida]|uniref:Uncharacterized protein n=1 Tax=Lasiosphaeria hispida TaxID=260671 RepID=A0AAJ0H8A1_9PEZI|nr:hypothetical protein B0T25DRAFT_464874 [Lasiosphaeria hispida]
MEEDPFIPERPHATTHTPWNKGLWISGLLLSFFLGVIASKLISLSLSNTFRTSTCHLPPASPDGDPSTGLPTDWFNGDCGSSSEVARYRGCQFSFVLHAWLPSDALSEEDMADEVLMHRGRNWPWALENGTEVAVESVRRGEFSHVYTAAEWHYVHCAYVWKRLHRTLRDGGNRRSKIDAYTSSFVHMEHCVKVLSGEHGGDGSGMEKSVVYAKFPACDYL